MRAVLTHPALIVSLMVGVDFTAVFAIVFGVSEELFTILLILGAITATVECASRLGSKTPPTICDK